jgi:hypothetical protein
LKNNKITINKFKNKNMPDEEIERTERLSFELSARRIESEEINAERSRHFRINDGDDTMEAYDKRRAEHELRHQLDGFHILHV